MTRVKKKINKVGVCHIHKLIDFLNCLNTGAHMVMDCEIHALWLCIGTHFVETFCNNFPLLVGIIRLFIKDWFCQIALNRIALLRRTDNLCAELMKFVAMSLECLDSFLVWIWGEVWRKPCVANLKSSYIKIFFQNIRVGRIFVADFRTFKACECHLGHALLKCVFCA